MHHFYSLAVPLVHNLVTELHFFFFLLNLILPSVLKYFTNTSLYFNAWLLNNWFTAGNQNTVHFQRMKVKINIPLTSITVREHQHLTAILVFVSLYKYIYNNLDRLCFDFVDGQCTVAVLNLILFYVIINFFISHYCCMMFTLCYIYS